MFRILIVDDEFAVRNILNDYFSAKGYEAHTAINGEEAIEQFRKIKPHVVILDIIMPGMGGIWALREIKKINPGAGVVMATGLIDEEMADKTLRIGASAYITKPVRLKDLETIVRGTIAHTHAGEETLLFHPALPEPFKNRG